LEGESLTKTSSENSETHPEKAVLVGLVDTSKQVIENEVERSIEELALLAGTAGAQVVGSAVQRRRGIDNATFVGKGKLQEIKAACEELGAELIIFDDELSGSQIRNIEEATGLKVIDRTLLILDIFAKRAQSKEGKLQVELAQQKYRYSRLVGFGESLSRLGGGIGTRGPGESKLETDRRHINRRIDLLKKALAEVGERRDRIREKRRDSDAVVIAVVGYTNAGKSTLINRLCASDLFAEDMLFATLDSAARKLVLPDGLEAVLVDTVGFIRKLPHNLIEAFKSTLEELVVADVILHVVDSSDEDLPRHMEIVEDLLIQLNASAKPRITVFNKIDIPDSSAQAVPVFPIGGAIEVDSEEVKAKEIETKEIETEGIKIEGIKTGADISAEKRKKPASDSGSKESDKEQNQTGHSPQLSERTYSFKNPSFNIKDGIVVQVSAVTGDGIDALLEVIKQQVEKAKTKITIMLPYKDAGVLDFIRKNGNVEEVEYLDTMIRAVIRIPPSKLAYIDQYMIK